MPRTVRVMEQWYEPGQPALGTNDFHFGRFGSLRSAWKFYEGELLLSRHCGKTQVIKGRHGVIEVIKHVDIYGSSRPCRDCQGLK